MQIATITVILFDICRYGCEMPCKKRDDYLEWPEYFMAVAFLAAQRSKDPNSQVKIWHMSMLRCTVYQNIKAIKVWPLRVIFLSNTKKTGEVVT